MKVGQDVRLFLSGDEEVTATIVKLGGAGDSGRKVLDVTYRDGTGDDAKDVLVEDVLHEVDAEPGEPFWLMKGERRSVEPAPTEVEEAEAPAAPDWPHAGLLADGGFDTWEKIAAASDDELLGVSGIAAGRLKEIRAYKPAE